MLRENVLTRPIEFRKALFKEWLTNKGCIGRLNAETSLPPRELTDSLPSAAARQAAGNTPRGTRRWGRCRVPSGPESLLAPGLRRRPRLPPVGVGWEVGRGLATEGVAKVHALALPVAACHIPAGMRERAALPCSGGRRRLSQTGAPCSGAAERFPSRLSVPRERSDWKLSVSRQWICRRRAQRIGWKELKRVVSEKNLY